MPKKELCKCKTCGAEFLDWPSQRGKNAYCSKACYAESLKGKTPHNKGKTNHISKSCPVCGEHITGEPSKVNRKKYCSQKCAGLGNRKAENMREYLLNRVTKIEGKDCWFWNGNLSGGYGRPNILGKQYYAHRLSYEEFIGPVPEGMQLDHLCRNRSCINPEHLEPVTQIENIRRGETGKGPRSEKHKESVSVATRKRLQDPNERAKQKAILDIARDSPNRLDALRKASQNPEYKKAQSERMKLIWAQRRKDKDADD